MATVPPPIASKLITGEEFALMDIPYPCELVRGRIVRMPPPNYDHSSIELNVGAPLHAFVQTHHLGRLGIGDGGLYTKRNPDTVRGADLTFTTHERLAQRDTTKAYLDVAPDLVAEVLSPSNTVALVKEKLEEYFAINVRIVWLVDPEARCVHVYRSMTDIRTFQENDTITGEDVLPGFEIQVAKFFENL